MKTNLSALTRLPANLGSLGLGSTIGTAAGVAGYFFIPTLSDHMSVQVASGLGGALGGATGAAAAKVLSPIVKKGSHYLLMLELDVQVRCGWLTPARAAQFRTQLQRGYFGGGSPGPRAGCAVLPAACGKTPSARGQSPPSVEANLASVLRANTGARRPHAR